jgi:hypothetical protein
VKRCHGCLRKITSENPSSTVDKWGNEMCDTCTLCVHSVALIDECTWCDADMKALFDLENEAESGECFTCGKNFLYVDDARDHIVQCRKAK